jgi:hypothetical protein
MVKRSIEIDETSDRLLTEWAERHGGNLGTAVVDLIQSSEGVELMMDHAELGSERILQHQKEASEKAFSEGRTITWAALKARHNL